MTTPLYLGLAWGSPPTKPTRDAVDALIRDLPFPVLRDEEPRGGLVLARNVIATRFLVHPQRPPHILLVDRDVAGFTAADVERMMGAREDVVGGPLPRRELELDRLARAFARGVPAERLKYHCSGRLMDYGDDGHALVKGHLVAVRYVSTGFLLLSRRAILDVAELVAQEHGQVTTLEGAPLADCFDFGRTSSGEHVGEDVAFCARWSRLDGVRKVYVDTKVALSHTGEVTFYAESIEDGFTHAAAATRTSSPTSQ
jgi:hypothetical protein